MSKSYSSSAILKHVKAGTECACLAVFETCRALVNLVPRGRDPFGQKTGIATSGQVQFRKSAIHGLPFTLRMPRVKSDKSDWFWSQSIVFT